MKKQKRKVPCAQHENPELPHCWHCGKRILFPSTSGKGTIPRKLVDAAAFMVTTYSAAGDRFDWHLRCIKSPLGEYKMLMHSEMLTDEQDEEARALMVDKQCIKDAIDQNEKLSVTHLMDAIRQQKLGFLTLH